MMYQNLQKKKKNTEMRNMKSGTNYQIAGFIGVFIAAGTWIMGSAENSNFGPAGFICIYLAVIIMALGNLTNKGD